VGSSSQPREGRDAPSADRIAQLVIARRARRAGRERSLPRPACERLGHTARVADMRPSRTFSIAVPATLPRAPGVTRCSQLAEVRREPIRLFLRGRSSNTARVCASTRAHDAHLVSSPAANHVLPRTTRTTASRTRGSGTCATSWATGCSPAKESLKAAAIAQPAFHRPAHRGFGRPWRVARGMPRTRSARAADPRPAPGIMRSPCGSSARRCAYDPTMPPTSGGGPRYRCRSPTSIEPPVRRPHRCFPTRENRKFRRALATLDSVVLRMIAGGAEGPADRGTCSPC